MEIDILCFEKQNKVAISEEVILQHGFVFIQMSNKKDYKKYAKPFNGNSIRINIYPNGNAFIVLKDCTKQLLFLDELKEIYFSITNQSLVKNIFTEKQQNRLSFLINKYKASKERFNF
ncbi:hypothetical protein [uncultured Flavobacterium sp.]|uniref:hypothetical protein n=1 Tax=uncultured Flavobacterium sp. TaxID=165435 RepID=UPI0030EF3A77|tara:strand:+ start:25268 stop:25621 length:354 start_codon:yes stop_codon:yes gene_type:complete